MIDQAMTVLEENTRSPNRRVALISPGAVVIPGSLSCGLSVVELGSGCAGGDAARTFVRGVT